MDFNNGYSAAVMAVSVAFNEMTSNRSAWHPHFGVCGSGAVRLNFIPQDDVLNSDTMSVSFQTCVGPPQLIQGRNDYFIGRSYWNRWPLFLQASPLWLCVETEQRDTNTTRWGYEHRHDVLSFKLSGTSTTNPSNNGYIGCSNDRKWKVLPSSERANTSGVCVFTLFTLGYMMTHWIWTNCSFWL